MIYISNHGGMECLEYVLFVMILCLGWASFRIFFCKVNENMVGIHRIKPDLVWCMCYCLCILVLYVFLLSTVLWNHRPSQHGADLLSLLSKLLDENTKPGQTANHSSVLVVSLALQALEELCKAEVCLVMSRDTCGHFCKERSLSLGLQITCIQVSVELKKRMLISM